jgi:hypothetical protein
VNPRALVACRETTLRGGRASVADGADGAAAAVARATERSGASPGNERGALGFVPRREARSFYSGSGGQYWYYLNLYYWAPVPSGGKDLWIKAEVVAARKDLRRWPDGAPVSTPPAKTTVEYWQVGATGRAMAIDNHKDFWLASENCCAGAIDVTMTLTLGRFQVRGPGGAWSKPRVPYVLDHRDYGTDAGLRPGDGKFDPLEGEPVNVWGYTIAWSACPARFVRSNWEGLAVPEIRLVKRIEAARSTRPAALTDDR